MRRRKCQQGQSRGLLRTAACSLAGAYGWASLDVAVGIGLSNLIADGEAIIVACGCIGAIAGATVYGIVGVRFNHEVHAEGVQLMNCGYWGVPLDA